MQSTKNTELNRKTKDLISNITFGIYANHDDAEIAVRGSNISIKLNDGSEYQLTISKSK